MVRRSTWIVAGSILAVLIGLAGNLAAGTLAWLPRDSAPWIWGSLIVLVLGAVLVDLYLRRQDTPTSTVDLDTAATALATGVGALLRAQEHQWQVHDPYPIPVRWTVGLDDLMDHWANIRRAGPGAHTDALALAGQLDQITTVYEQIPSGRLVILGKAGAGKTILAGRLVAGLLEIRTAGQRVPVVFSLSTWNPDTAQLSTWLAARLIEDFPGLAARGPGGRTVADELIAADRILPILDGFDEIATGAQHAALTALNRTTIPLVLTSRPDEYRDAVTAIDVLTAAAVVTLVDLTTADVTEYLARASSPAARTRLQPVIAELTSDPPSAEAAVLAEALTTPLMLYLARTVYSDTPRDPVDLLDTARRSTSDAVEEHLLAAFIPAAYAPVAGRRRRPWDDPELAMRWHGYLATHLHRLNTHDLAWWRLRDAVPGAVGALVTACAVAVAMGLLLMLPFGPPLGFAIGSVIGVLYGGTAWILDPPLPQRTHLQLTRSQLLVDVSAGLVGGLAAGILAGYAFGLIGGLVFGAAGAFGFGFAFVLVDLSVTPRLDAVYSPHDLLRMDRRQAVVVALTGGLLGPAGGLVGGFISAFGVVLASALMAGRVIGRTVGLPFDLPFGIRQGLLPGFLVLVAAGFAVVLAFTAWGQWFLHTRLVLPALGKLPWPLFAFLADAHHRGILRQAGGVYRYRHARLRDRLAAGAPKERTMVTGNVGAG